MRGSTTAMRQRAVAVAPAAAIDIESGYPESANARRITNTNSQKRRYARHRVRNCPGAPRASVFAFLAASRSPDLRRV